MNLQDSITRAAQWINNSKHTAVFTGSGISIESGIPTFRGKEGIWNKYNPEMVEIQYFRRHPKESWGVLKEIFYNYFGNVQPNDAHRVIAELEKMGIVKAVVTQNIDNLHQEAGSKTVYEFHGTSRTMSCMGCGSMFESKVISLDVLPPRCMTCMGILKPDFIFFGEPIPREASMLSFYEAQTADVVLVIGTTGEVFPACQVPINAKENGARVIEVNTEPSQFTFGITDIFLQGKATEIMNELLKEIKKTS